MLTFSVTLPETQYDRARKVQFYRQLLERLERLPGVQSAGGGGPLPLTGTRMAVAFDIRERPAAPWNRPHADMAIVTPGYFRTLGIPLLEGRAFTERDDAMAPPVLVVNQAFADRFFPGENVVGKRIDPGATSGGHGTAPREIVGVAGNARQAPLSLAADPIYYFPFPQLPWFIDSVVLRTSIPPRSLESAVRAVVASLDSQLPVFGAGTMEDLESTVVARPRFHLLLLASFAGIALLLTAVGLYGVMAFAVGQRTHEIGVRMALGARRGNILATVIRGGLLAAAAGILAGVASALALTRFLR
ncbi:MAG: ABC transporter permease, partial [Pseudomonadota bacterium]